MPKDTPLLSLHKELKGRIVDFAGWNLPVMYTGIIEEHLAVRNQAGLFDVSHMGQAIVEGKDALAFLNYAFSNNYTAQKSMSVKYGIFCDKNGFPIDDLMVYKINDTKYLIVLNASNAEKDVIEMQKIAKDFDIKITDVSENYSMLALQGKRAMEAFKNSFKGDFSNFKRFDIIEQDSMLISYTGYTGSDGVEILCAPDKATELAKKIFAENNFVLPCGLGARDSLRLEARYPLYGHEISESISAIEAGLSWAVKFDKDFQGKDALLKMKENPVQRKVKYFVVKDKRAVRQGAEILQDGNKVATVLSGTYSPTLTAPIGSALFENKDLPNTDLYVNIRDTKVNIELVEKFL